MAEFNFFQLIPEAALMDPLSIKSEIKDECDLSDPVDVSSTFDVNEERRKSKQRRTIDLAIFSPDTTSSSIMTSNNENSNKSVDYTDCCMTFRNGESSNNTKSELEVLLTKGGDGKIIKRSYKTNGGFLPDTVRTILVHLIVKHEMDKALSTLSDDGEEKLEEFTVTSTQMQNYASDIVKLFPSEKVDTYFGGFKTVNGVRILAHGKLWDHYNYMKSVLRDQGVLEGRKFKKKKPERPTVVDEETRKKLDWLLNNPLPWSEVFQNWKETFQARTEGHSELELKQLFEYYQTYPCLRDQQAVVLIQSDFDRLYTKKPFNFTESWNAVKPHLISKLQTCKAIKTLDDKAYVHLLPSLTAEQQDGVILFLLPYLVPCGRKKRRNDDQEETRKLTSNERRETFIIYIPSAADVDSTLEKKREDLKRSGRILHPTPVGVGSVMGVSAAYVAVDNVKYEVSSLLNAIDLSYKIYHAAHCDYPESCHSLWLFMQKALFDIHYPNDRATPSLHALVGEVRRVIDSKANS